MNSPTWKLSEQDRQFFARELDDFLPDKLYDAHAHLGPRSDYGPKHAHLVANTPASSDLAAYKSHWDWIAPGRQFAGAMIIPAGLTGTGRRESNRFAAAQAAEDPRCGSALVISPTMAAEQLRSEIAEFRPVALKPYHLMSGIEPSGDALVEDYLPERLVAVADEARLPIIVHLVRPRGLADEGNRRTIRAYCRRYPAMTLVLAHCARGFNPSHAVEGIALLGDLQNVFFDTSCVCESGAMEAILKTFGPSRIMWGSDYPFSHLHGRCVAVNDSFTWLYDCDFDLGPYSLDARQQFTLVGLESLRMLKFACRACQVTNSQLEDVFCNNAKKLFDHTK